MLRKILKVFGRRHAYLVILLSIPLITLIVSLLAALTRTTPLMVKPQRISKSTKQRVEGEVIELRTTGFEPGRITRSAGPFLLWLNNHSRLPIAELRVERADGVVVRSISLPAEARTWSDVVDLPQGHYILREVTHSYWSCHITLR